MEKSLKRKPSVARQFASALGVGGSRDGYIENDRWVITWCVGHLVSLIYPEAYDPTLKKVEHGYIAVSVRALSL